MEVLDKSGLSYLWSKLKTLLAGKASASDVSSHTGNTTVHITAAERTAWNAKAGTSAATQSSSGLMSANDKKKLDGIAEGATASSGTITAVQANGTNVATSGTANIPAASTSVYGVTKLSSSTASTSTVLAATASAVKAAYDLANGKATVTSGTTDLTAKSSALTTGTIYLCYE